MVKVLTFLKRKTGMPVEEFQDYSRTRHPDVVTRLPGIRRYVQSHVLPTAYAKGEPVHDGIAEVWADDTNALRAMTRSPEHVRLQADEAKFIDRARMGFVITEDHVAVEGAVGFGGVKAVEFLTGRPDLSVETFQRHLCDAHAPLGAKIPSLRRYVVSIVRAAAYGPGRAPAYDAVVLLWFDSVDTLRTAGGTPEYQATVADRVHFLAAGAPPFIVTHEHVIIG